MLHTRVTCGSSVRERGGAQTQRERNAHQLHAQLAAERDMRFLAGRDHELHSLVVAAAASVRGAARLLRGGGGGHRL
jgi:hypothetical protein